MKNKVLVIIATMMRVQLLLKCTVNPNTINGGSSKRL